jgi:hypothetical protein
MLDHSDGYTTKQLRDPLTTQQEQLALCKT